MSSSQFIIRTSNKLGKFDDAIATRFSLLLILIIGAMDGKYVDDNFSTNNFLNLLY